VAGVLHDDEIPIDAGLVPALIDRAMPHYVDLPVRQLDSSGSTNALFRLGENLLVRPARRIGGDRERGQVAAGSRAFAAGWCSSAGARRALGGGTGLWRTVGLGPRSRALTGTICDLV
jgi:hypothetical protein